MTKLNKKVHTCHAICEECGEGDYYYDTPKECPDCGAEMNESCIEKLDSNGNHFADTSIEDGIKQQVVSLLTKDKHMENVCWYRDDIDRDDIEFLEGFDVEGDTTISHATMRDGTEYYCLNICDVWTEISKDFYMKLRIVGKQLNRK
jgi:hypothetical protein